LNVTPSSGNVFRDLGFSTEAELPLIRADLLIQLQKVIASGGLRKSTRPRSHASRSPA